MQPTPALLGKLIKETRTGLGLTQEKLALASGVGLRFIIELEKGKPTCQLGKTLTVLNTLGVKIALTPPQKESREDRSAERDQGTQHGTNP